MVFSNIILALCVVGGYVALLNGALRRDRPNFKTQLTQTVQAERLLRGTNEAGNNASSDGRVYLTGVAPSSDPTNAAVGSDRVLSAPFVTVPVLTRTSAPLIYLTRYPAGTSTPAATVFQRFIPTRFVPTRQPSSGGGGGTVIIRITQPAQIYLTIIPPPPPVIVRETVIVDMVITATQTPTLTPTPTQTATNTPEVTPEITIEVTENVIPTETPAPSETPTSFLVTSTLQPDTETPMPEDNTFGQNAALFVTENPSLIVTIDPVQDISTDVP